MDGTTATLPVEGIAPAIKNINGALHHLDPVTSVHYPATEPLSIKVDETSASDDDDLAGFDGDGGEAAIRRPIVDHASGALARVTQGSIPSIDVVHEALKGPEYGFNLSIAGLEKEARRLGREWAESGLPRHDLDRNAPIEAETVLAQRAGEIYAAWIRRVRQKVDAAIATHRALLDRALEGGFRALDTYQDADRTIQQLAPRSPEGVRSPNSPVPAWRTSATNLDTPPQATTIVGALDPIPATVPDPGLATIVESQTHAPIEPVRLACRKFGAAFWLLATVLVLAEFVANAPVFAEIFPLSREVDARVTRELAESATSVWLLGLQDVALRLLASPEPAFLALAVVTFFLFLGHHVGGEARALVVLREPVLEVAHEEIRRSRRQALWACVCSLSGVGIMVVVLFAVRAQVAPMAEQRLQAATKQLAAAEQNVVVALGKGEDHERIEARREAVYDAQEARDRRVTRMDYATSIKGANWPIAGMNLVLAIVAALAGYFRRELDLPRLTSEGSGVNMTPAVATAPLLPSPRETDHVASDGEAEVKVDASRGRLTARLDELREAMRISRQQLETAIADGDRAYAAATQLLSCNPTAKWEGMVKRLECAVPLFRAENSLARKLDPLDIKGFRKSVTLDLAAPDEHPMRVDVREGIEAAHERLHGLRTAAARLALHGRFADRAVDSHSPEVVS